MFVFQEDVVEDGVWIRGNKIAKLIVKFPLSAEACFAIVEVVADFLVFLMIDW